jgi:FkbM family methyltransferase
MNKTRQKKKGLLVSLCQKLARRIVLSMPLFIQDGLRLLYSSDANVEFCLRKLKEKGFAPENVVDCGAYVGNWTRMVKRNFLESNVLMIEPQADKESLLIQVCNEFPGTVNYVRCLLGCEPKEAVTFFEMESGSSVLGELTDVPRKAVTLRMVPLDDVLRERKITKAMFLKLDVQGYELEVLKGAKQALKNSEVVLLEVSFVLYNQSAPLFHEVVEFMKDRGFLMYDICPLQRWADNTLLQADVFFVKKDSPFRRIDFMVTDHPSVSSSTAPR